jgi:hypothetical protein
MTEKVDAVVIRLRRWYPIPPPNQPPPAGAKIQRGPYRALAWHEMRAVLAAGRLRLAHNAMTLKWPSLISGHRIFLPIPAGGPTSGAREFRV